jgi:hypothetical protein
MPVSVDYPSHREVGDGRELVFQLLALAVRGAGVDQKDSIGPDHHPDVEVEGLIAASEDSIAEFIEHRATLASKSSS